MVMKRVAALVPRGSVGALCVLLPLLAGSLLSEPALAADKVLLRLVSDVPSMQGKQAQAPIWAPGVTPRLVHEITDRDRRTWLRQLWIEGASTFDAIVPGSRSSRVEALGGAADRADTGVSWWDGFSFFFVRAVGGTSSLYYFDGGPREVPGLKGRVHEVAADKTRGRLFAAVEQDGQLDVYRLSGKGFTSDQVRLSHSPTGVEHSLAIEAKAGALHWIAATRAGTRLGIADPPEPDAVRERVSIEGLDRYEILSLAVVPGGDEVLLYARLPRDEGSSAPEQRLLLAVHGRSAGNAQTTVLARNIYLPSGMAPRPAFSHGGRFVYFIAADTTAGNPVVRLDRDSGTTQNLRLGTMGNQELAVAEYPSQGGSMVPWLAVVAVGDDKGRDVRNHLYAGPLEGWPGWQEGDK